VRLAREHARAHGREPAPALINFGAARRAVFTCPIWDWQDVTANCRRRLLATAADPDAVDTVFLGAAYGYEDRFRTPIGDQFGVAIHAFTAYSLRDPVRHLVPFSFAFDVVLGVLSAVVFQLLWGAAARCRAQSGRRFLFVTAVFGVLGLLAAGAAWITPWMLNRGAWLNPLLILGAFFLDSYQGAAEHVRAATAHEPAPRGGRARRWALDFIGLGHEGIPTVTWRGLREQPLEAWFQVVKRLVVYWSVVLCGLWFATLA
jgi:hypothetical protein